MTRSLSRYVGLTRARVSEREIRKLTYEQYIEWLDEIISLLNDRKIELLSVLNRYAPTIDFKAGQAEAQSIQFDIDEFQELFVHKKTHRKIDFDDTFSEIINGKFSITLILDQANPPKQEECKFSITYNSKKSSLHISFK